MRNNDLSSEYFDWLLHFVCDSRYLKYTSYQKLMHHLHEVTYEYTISLDGDRAEDGVDLRYRFAYEKGYGGPMIATYLDNHPCSMLEMMIALAIRCEEHIMEDPDEGDRTGLWFWNMIVSLGLGGMTDSQYNPEQVDRVLERFFQRKYKRNGEGSLFTVEHTYRDMRDLTIWYQMCSYLNESYNS